MARDTTLIDTCHGPVRGADDGKVKVWKGVRYAAPPVAELWLADGHSQAAPVYLYRFDWTTPMLKLLRIGATHATELPYVFGNLVQGPLDITFKLGGLSTGRAVSTRIRARWLNFATNATPTGLPEEPEWKAYRDPDRASLMIDSTDSVVSEADADIRAAWGDEVLNFR